jgi:hypothetical protein
VRREQLEFLTQRSQLRAQRPPANLRGWGLESGTQPAGPARAAEQALQHRLMSADAVEIPTVSATEAARRRRWVSNMEPRNNVKF